jgi:pyruvate/2-oxoglutarate dehydrogenase complex dihydrolipoamide dehydrogenase (E3) component
MYDLVVLGGGTGGLEVATASAHVGARVALVEKGRPGGERIRSADVPVHALIAAARRARDVRTAGTLGIKAGAPEVDFPAVMARVRDVVAEIATEVSDDALRARGIEVVHGSPAFESHDTVVVDGATRLVAQRFVIATGSRAAAPDVPGLAEAGALDHTTIWGLDALPAELVVIGSGPNGLVLAQAFARLGSRVTVLSFSEHLLPREDPEVSSLVREAMEAEGIAIRTGAQVTGVSVRDGRKVCACRDKDGSPCEVSGTHILLAVGRLPNIEGLNLEAVGVHADAEHGIEVDEYLQTRTPRILAVGDVLKRDMYTHAAEREAAVAFQNAVLRIPKKINYLAMPWSTYVDPEVASVGVTEAVARQRYPEVRAFRVEMAQIDRARAEGRTAGFARVVATPSGKILGATVVGERASEALQELVLAMDHGLSLGDIASTVHISPSYAGVARALARQYAATRLERPHIRKALRWFLGYQPRSEADGAETAPAPEPAGHHGH